MFNYYSRENEPITKRHMQKAEARVSELINYEEHFISDTFRKYAEYNPKSEENVREDKKIKWRCQ